MRQRRVRGLRPAPVHGWERLGIQRAVQLCPTVARAIVGSGASAAEARLELRQGAQKIDRAAMIRVRIHAQLLPLPGIDAVGQIDLWEGVRRRYTIGHVPDVLLGPAAVDGPAPPRTRSARSKRTCRGIEQNRAVAAVLGPRLSKVQDGDAFVGGLALRTALVGERDLARQVLAIYGRQAEPSRGKRELRRAARDGPTRLCVRTGGLAGSCSRVRCRSARTGRGVTGKGAPHFHCAANPCCGAVHAVTAAL